MTQEEDDLLEWEDKLRRVVDEFLDFLRNSSVLDESPGDEIRTVVEDTLCDAGE